jgi:hypothetical protein
MCHIDQVFSYFQVDWVNREINLTLYSFTTKINITLRKAKSMVDIHEIFQLSLTNEAYQQYNTLISETENIEINYETDK